MIKIGKLDRIINRYPFLVKIKLVFLLLITKKKIPINQS